MKYDNPEYQLRKRIRQRLTKAASSIQYSGGCNKHDFFLVGTCPNHLENPATLTLHIIHDDHGDACDAWISDTLKFDLSPLRSCNLSAETVELGFLFDGIEPLIFSL